MIFIRLLSMLPLRLLHLFSSLIAFLLYDIVGYRKAIVMDNLQRSFPGKSEKELQTITKNFYLNLTDVLIETLKGYSISRGEIKRRVEIQGLEHLMTPHQQGQQIMVLTSHSCNWEWVLLGISARLDAPLYGVYKPLSNPFFDRLIKYIRGRFGAKPLPMQQLAKRMIKMRKESEIYGLVADQSPQGRKNVPYFWKMFLNQETVFYRGAAVLAPKLQAVIVYISMERIKRGYYQLTISPLRNPPYDKAEDLNILHEYAHRLEKDIQKQPANWLWTHKRWKQKRPEIAPLHHWDTNT